MYILQQQFEAIEGQEASLRNVLLTISNEMAQEDACQMYMVTMRSNQTAFFDLIAIFDDEQSYFEAINRKNIQDLATHLNTYAKNANPEIQTYGIVGGYFNLGTATT